MPPDTALAAFAQLGALRLNCKRALISCFDRRNQFVLAEATRSLSLQTGTHEDKSDYYWLGTGVYARGNSICEETAQYLNPSHRLGITVIPDLIKNESYKDKKFVQGPPNARFYAGIPIVTASGYAIGSYCVLDDQPRAGLSEWELSFLQDMVRCKF